MSDQRENFSRRITSFFSSLSSAVGLGNIWKFPVMAGLFGGATFILCYFFFTILIGIPVMISEFIIGRRTRTNAVNAFDVLGKPYMKIAGVLGLIGSLFIVFFYSSVAGWVYSYIFKTISGEFNELSGQTIQQAGEASAGVFGKLLNALWAPAGWQLLAIAMVAVVLILGVKKGIERLAKILMPVLFILIIVCAIRGLTQEGAVEGLKFMFLPDFSNFDSAVILSAMGLAFFKLSVGTGTMTTYGSYFTKNTNLPGTALKVCFSDIAVSLLAGMAIFPVVFSFGLTPEQGPSLLFVTIPLVFSKIPLGTLFMLIFFISAAIAATMAMISLVEPVVAYLSSKKSFSRNKAVFVVTGAIAVVGFLTVHQQSFFNKLSTFGLDGVFASLGIKDFFGFFDYFSQNVLLPLAGLLFVITVGWLVNEKVFKDELTNEGTVNLGVYAMWRFIIRYVSPLLIIVVFLQSVGLFAKFLKIFGIEI